MLRRYLCLAILSTGPLAVGLASAEEKDTHSGLPLVFSEDYEQGVDRWETTDDNAWELHDGADGKAFGSWAQEHELNLVTYEFEAASLYDLKERHAPVLIELLTGQVDLEAL